MVAPGTSEILLLGLAGVSGRCPIPWAEWELGTGVFREADEEGKVMKGRKKQAYPGACLLQTLERRNAKPEINEEEEEGEASLLRGSPFTEPPDEGKCIRHLRR